jgi:hypothetical protein
MEFFRAVRPACTMVEVSGLVDPAMLVEIEADAVVAGNSSRTSGIGFRRATRSVAFSHSPKAVLSSSLWESMKIGVPKETAANERRVALTPEDSQRLVKAGLTVVVAVGGRGRRCGDGLLCRRFTAGATAKEVSGRATLCQGAAPRPMSRIVPRGRRAVAVFQLPRRGMLSRGWPPARSRRSASRCCRASPARSDGRVVSPRRPWQGIRPSSWRPYHRPVLRCSSRPPTRRRLVLVLGAG